MLSRIKVNIDRESSASIPLAPEVAADNATLVPLDDSDAPPLPLPLGRHTTIGRAPESDLRLTDSSVSRRHAVLTVGPKGAFIEDVRSVNGVSVNRQRIRHALSLTATSSSLDYGDLGSRHRWAGRQTQARRFEVEG